jgi:hypothetical protein
MPGVLNNSLRNEQLVKTCGIFKRKTRREWTLLCCEVRVLHASKIRDSLLFGSMIVRDCLYAQVETLSTMSSLKQTGGILQVSNVPEASRNATLRGE